MPKQQEDFGADTAPDNVSMPTLNAMQRPTVIEKEAANVARRNKRASRIAPANPYKSGWNEENHAALIGF